MNTQATEAVQYFPVVGAPGMTSEAARPYDARWYVVDAMGRPLDGDVAGLHNVSVDIRFGYLVLRAPDMLRLDIPLDVIEDDPSVLETLQLDGVAVQAADEGAWAAAWFTQVLGQPARLLKVCVSA